MTTHEILHIIRNPWGWSEDEVRAARLAAADLIEQQAKEIAALRTGDTCGRSCEGTAYRIELRQALAKVEWQAKQIEALRGFAQDVMEGWPETGIDGGDLQELAEKHGLLEMD